MPDWFYRTASQPVLFRLSAGRARDLALGFMGGLARLPLGPSFIDFLGHMRPDDRLGRTFLGIDFPTVVGLGPGLDTRAAALPALARFGFGFLEVGPVTIDGTSGGQAIERQTDRGALWFADPPGSLSLSAARTRLTEAAGLGLPLIVRLGHSASEATEGCQRLIHELAPYVQVFSLSTLGLAIAEGWSIERWSAHLRAVLEEARAARPLRPVLLCVAADLDSDVAAPFIHAGLKAGVVGALVDGSIRAEPAGRLIGLPAREPAVDLVRYLRLGWGRDLLIIAAGGVHEPEHALALRSAGADLVEVDSGLVYSGPGLPKRINDLFLFECTRGTLPTDPPERTPEMTWFWTTLMGGGMLFGSLLALAIAATRIVLPYDEVHVGLSREEFALVNPRLLAFMAHDRVSLAGTMVAIGVMYVGLSLFGIRRGSHWAQQTVFISAFTGFASFFLFLGYGYLDIFHAFVSAALLQLLLLGVHCRLGVYVPAIRPDTRSDWAWRLSLWGQFLLIIHGFALLAAGAVISTIGITQVFVPEDLEFMQTTAEALRSANPRLVPVVAHDRASFGGMLLASGWVFLLPALWGYRNGTAWLWWTFLIAGLSAYVAAIGVHFAVGYTNLMHLLPAFSGLGLFLIGLSLSYSYLCRQGPVMDSRVS